MNLGEWSVRNHVTVSVMLVMILAGGLMSYTTISRKENPEFTVRTATVTTIFPGASPRKVEELVTDKLEEKIREMPEIKNVRSQSLTGMSLIMVDIHDKYKNMHEIWQKLRNKVSDARPDLPDGVMTPRINDEFGDVFGVVVALTGDGYTYREMKDVSDFVRNQLLKLGNVGKVERYGVQEERIFAEFSNARLAEYGFSPAHLAQMLSEQNVLQPGGDAVVGTERIIISATGEFKSVAQLRQTSLQIPGRPEAIALGDIADIRRGFIDPPRTLARFNGEPAIVIAVNMAKGGNVIEMGQAVMKRLREIESRLPVGLDFHLLSYQPRFVERSISEFMVNLLEAFVFVVVVVLLFAGLRTGLIVGTLVPMAMMACIALMPPFGVELQKMSIASLIIALGMLVDNGVVVSENMLVRMAGGEDRLAAAAHAVRTLWKPLLSASLTTILAFLPIYIAESDTGEYCGSLFVVVTLTLMASWLLSLTMMPLLCHYFLRPRQQKQTFAGRFYRIYRGGLILCLRRRTLFLLAVIGLITLSLWGMKFVPKIFFPPNDREMFVIDFFQPYGTDIEATVRRVARVEKFLRAHDEVVSVGSFIGNGGPRWYLSLSLEDRGANYAKLVINTRTVEGMAKLTEETRHYLDRNFPDTRHSVLRLENGPIVGAPIQLRISGDDYHTLYRLRDAITKAIYPIPGVTNIRDDWGEWTKKLEVEVRQDQAKRAGFSSRDIALSLQTQLSGLPATDFREGKEIIPVVLRSKEAWRRDLGKIESLNVYSFRDGRSTPLMQLASTRLVWQPSNIRRRNQTRTMTVKVDVTGRFTSAVLADVMAAVKKLQASEDWPVGYFLEYGGEKEESGESQKSLAAKFPLAFGLMALLLVAQFNAIRAPVIIVLTVFPMFIGITAGLLLTGDPFGFMALLGVVSLFGILVNNAIMMIDQIEIEKAAGQTLQDAIVVSAQKRFRPIIMTAITTIMGLVPLSLQGGTLWSPLANVLIFGLAFSTVLTLALCPVLYAVFFRTGFGGYQWDAEVLEKGE
ncbi:AcrB/AcrD/AcrF family protein [Desulfonema ishimotonii]|uniref:AcrB/AcrD/AcrF family protein n=1 Tax=Desulfonema ishimotonii TaxID=45657 RepID=A0A401G4M0_9BACT|nr:efflux RND transporter permease subunit [Desulfonema ishimotonii]GBC64141.1 AcrB/AcrD/AcrF family protein [Desulfonema ishimotonii]